MYCLSISSVDTIHYKKNNLNTCDRLNLYSQRHHLALKMTALYRFQKSINKRNTPVNGSLLKFTYFRVCVLACVNCFFPFSAPA